MSKLTIVYVVNAKVPEEVRAEKICASLVNHGHKVIIACKWSGESAIREDYDGYTLIRLGKGKGAFSHVHLPVRCGTLLFTLHWCHKLAPIPFFYYLKQANKKTGLSLVF